MAEEEEWLSINSADLSVASASTVSDFEESRRWSSWRWIRRRCC